MYIFGASLFDSLLEMLGLDPPLSQNIPFALLAASTAGSLHAK